MPRFVHLHTHSHYSLLDGLAKIDELVNRAKELGMDALAVTDHGNLYGAIEFYKKAKAAGIKPILGVEAYVAPASRFDRHLNHNGGKYHHLILLAKNQTGWKNLIQLATKGYLEGFYYKPRVDKELLREYHEGLIALSGCLAGETARHLLSGRMNEAEETARSYEEIFSQGNFYLEIGDHPGVPDVKKLRPLLIELSKKTGIPLAATQDIHYLKVEDAEYHEILLAVQTGNKLDDPERLSFKQEKFHMASPEEMAEKFKDVPEALQSTVKIAEACNLELELGKVKLPKFELPRGETANSFLEKLVAERVKNRYPEMTEEVKKRIAYELGVIEKTGFADYFLIVQDFVNWAKERQIVVGPGRGSAAGSIISYILNITDIDPLKYDLLFERFLNPDRIQMPDIDIDFTDLRRDEVLGYLREKYGEDHVAQIITFGTMAARAGVRDVGRSLGMSYGFCDQIAKLIPFNQTIDEAIKNVSDLKQLYDTNADAKRILEGARHLEGVARHASVHACGTVIAGEPLTNYLPLQRAPQDEKVIITQFEMHAVEDLGLLKMDLLGLRNLTTIEDTVRLIRDLRGESVNISALPLDDKKTFALLQAAGTVGVFQLESSGMQRYLKDLKPTELEDIIAMVSLYRPGPIELIPEYVARKHGQKPVRYLHPRLEPILKNTYGICIYQEQLLSAVRELAGFTLAEADVLRKAVGKKIKKLLDQQEIKFKEGAAKNGVSKDIADKFWELVEPFNRYAFNRSHAACYAMIAYQTAYLKAHYPVEFMSSLLNNEAGDIDRTAFLVAEVKRMGMEILPPDINKSSARFIPENKNIRFGLAAVKNVGENIVQAIIENRERQGPFKNLADLLMRIQHKDLNKKSLESLAKCGALDSLGTERNQIIQNIDDIIRFAALARKQETAQVGLFGSNGLSSQALKLKPAEPAAPQQKLAWEKELLGLYVSDHPLNHYKTKIEMAKVRPIKEVIATFADNRRCRIAGIISKTNPIVTKTGKPMLFAKIEDFGDSIEVIVFPETLLKTNKIWKESGAVLVTGKFSARNGERKLICDDATEL